MKVKDLIIILQNANPELEVFCTSNGDFEYSLVESASTSELTFKSPYGGEDDPCEEVFLIDEQ